MSLVYIWYPHRDPSKEKLRESCCIGHSSMHIGSHRGSNHNKCYVSWWPDKDEYGHDLAEAKPKTLNEDIEAEGAEPHVKYLLYDFDFKTGQQFLDVDGMMREWRSIRHKKDATYRTLAKNCSTIVGRVLRAGGVENLVGRIKRVSYMHNMYWTPKDVAQLCDQLKKLGYAEKCDSAAKPGKWKAMTLIGLR